jgi:hypothetical protein
LIVSLREETVESFFSLNVPVLVADVCSGTLRLGWRWCLLNPWYQSLPTISSLEGCKTSFWHCEFESQKPVLSSHLTFLPKVIFHKLILLFLYVSILNRPRIFLCTISTSILSSFIGRLLLSPRRKCLLPSDIHSYCLYCVFHSFLFTEMLKPFLSARTNFLFYIFVFALWNFAA